MKAQTVGGGADGRRRQWVASIHETVALADKAESVPQISEFKFWQARPGCKLCMYRLSQTGTCQRHSPVQESCTKRRPQLHTLSIHISDGDWQRLANVRPEYLVPLAHSLPALPSGLPPALRVWLPGQRAVST